MKGRLLRVASIVLIVWAGCATRRDDIIHEAFTEPFMDYYSLKLYSNGEFDLHVPVIDYYGRYIMSGDTVKLRSIEHEPRKMSVTVNGRVMTKTITEMSWHFVIDDERKKLRSVSASDSSETIVIDIVANRLTINAR